MCAVPRRRSSSESGSRLLEHPLRPWPPVGDLPQRRAWCGGGQRRILLTLPRSRHGVLARVPFPRGSRSGCGLGQRPGSSWISDPANRLQPRVVEVDARPPSLRDHLIFQRDPGCRQVFGLKLAIDKPAGKPNAACPPMPKSSPPDRRAAHRCCGEPWLGLHKALRQPPGLLAGLEFSVRAGEIFAA